MGFPVFQSGQVSVSSLNKKYLFLCLPSLRQTVLISANIHKTKKEELESPALLGLGKRGKTCV